MSLLALAAAAVLTLSDPTSDALGDGGLVPPTSPVYANTAIFDLHEVRLDLTATETSGGVASGGVPAQDGGAARAGAGASLAVTLGAVDLSLDSPAGFSGVVVDVYIDSGPGGSDTTLTGPGMLLPAGSGWEYAVRLSPAGAFGIEYQEEATSAADTSSEAVTPLEPGSVPPPDSDDERLALRPLQLRIDGNRLVVDLPWLIDEDAVVYAVTGVYDPFSSDSWRSLASSPSPWAFSGGEEQVVPVVDVLAVDQETQARVLRTGVLPQPQRTASSGLVWIALMVVGVALAVTGLVLRRRVAPAERTGRPYGLPPEEPEEEQERVVVEEPGEERPAELEPLAANGEQHTSELDRPFGLPPLEDEDDVTETVEPEGEGQQGEVLDDEVPNGEIASGGSSEVPGSEDDRDDPFVGFADGDSEEDDDEIDLSGFDERESPGASGAG